jgi:beta-lactam-binding protein with PASTA domain
MPNVVGENLQSAIEALQAAGVYNPALIGYFGTDPLYAAWTRTPGVIPGQVLNQSVAAGTNVSVNSMLVLQCQEFRVACVFPTAPWIYSPSPPPPTESFTADSTITADSTDTADSA